MDENKIPLQTEDEAVDADAIMAEFDRESNTRIFTGWRKTVTTQIIMLNIISLYITAINRTRYVSSNQLLSVFLYTSY